jgi:hypothetical protein
LDADLRQDLKLDYLYRRARTASDVDEAVGRVAKETGFQPQRYKELASIQGIDLEDLDKKARGGMPFENYRQAKKEAIGFIPVEQRSAMFEEVAKDYAAAEKGEIRTDKRIDLSAAKEAPGTIPGFTTGYVIGMTTAEETPEVVKPGEHYYAVAQKFIEAVDKDPEVVKLVNLYGNSFAGGASQKYIHDRALQIMKNKRITPASPDADRQAGLARRQATFEVLARKTVGQWVPGIFVKDVQVTDDATQTENPLAALAANVELIGFNNKGDAVFRQESPAGVVLRTLDLIGVVPIPGKGKIIPIPIPGQSLLAGLATRGEDETYMAAASRGVQTGANWLEYALDESKGAPLPLRAVAGVGGMLAAVVHPDVTAAAGSLNKAQKAFRIGRINKQVAKEAVPILEELIKAYKAENFELSSELEKKLAASELLGERSKKHSIVKAFDRNDAAFAMALAAINPALKHTDPFLVDNLIAAVSRNGSKDLTELVYETAGTGAPHMHFSAAAPEMAAVGKDGERGASFMTFLDSGNFSRRRERLQMAKAAYLKEIPQTAEAAISKTIDDAIERIKGDPDSARILGATEEEIQRDLRLAELMDQNRAALISDPSGDTFRNILRADPITGGDANVTWRKGVYQSELARTTKRIKSLTSTDYTSAKAADLQMFDDALEAVSTNVRSRMMAAESLRRNLADLAEIRVTPIDILDDMLVPGTERLSPYAQASFFTTVRQFSKEEMDREGLYTAYQALDAAFLARAERNGVPVETIWRDFLVQVTKGEVELPGAAAAKAAGKPPPAPPATLPATPGDVSGLAAVPTADPALNAAITAAAKGATKKAAATAKAAPTLHPQTASLVSKLPPAMGATPQKVSLVLSLADGLKPGEEFVYAAKKTPGVSKVMFGAIQEQLLESGVLIKTDDGKIVKSAPAVAPAPAPAAGVAGSTPAARQARALQDRIDEVNSLLEKVGDDLDAAMQNGDDVARVELERTQEILVTRRNGFKAKLGEVEAEVEAAAAPAPVAAPAATPAAAPAAKAAAPALSEVELSFLANDRKQLASAKAALEQEVQRIAPKLKAESDAMALVNQTSAKLKTEGQSLRSAMDAVDVAEKKLLAFGEKATARKALTDAEARMGEAKRADADARKAYAKAKTEADAANAAPGFKRAHDAVQSSESRLRMGEKFMAAAAARRATEAAAPKLASPPVSPPQVEPAAVAPVAKVAAPAPAAAAPTPNRDAGLELQTKSSEVARTLRAMPEALTLPGHGQLLLALSLNRVSPEQIDALRALDNNGMLRLINAMNPPGTTVEKALAQVAETPVAAPKAAEAVVEAAPVVGAKAAETVAPAKGLGAPRDETLAEAVTRARDSLRGNVDDTVYEAGDTRTLLERILDQKGTIESMWNSGEFVADSRAYPFEEAWPYIERAARPEADWVYEERAAAAAAQAKAAKAPRGRKAAAPVAAQAPAPVVEAAPVAAKVEPAPAPPPAATLENLGNREVWQAVESTTTSKKKITAAMQGLPPTLKADVGGIEFRLSAVPQEKKATIFRVMAKSGGELENLGGDFASVEDALRALTPTASGPAPLRAEIDSLIRGGVQKADNTAKAAKQAARQKTLTPTQLLAREFNEAFGYDATDKVSVSKLKAAAKLAGESAGASGETYAEAFAKYDEFVKTALKEPTRVEDALKTIREEFELGLKRGQSLLAPVEAVAPTVSIEQKLAKAKEEIGQLTHVRREADGTMTYGKVEGDNFVPMYALGPSQQRNSAEALYDAINAGQKSIDNPAALAKPGVREANMQPILAKLDKLAGEGDLFSVNTSRIRRDVERVDIDRATKDRQVTAMINRLHGIAPAVEWDEIPEALRVAAGSRLNRAEEGLNAAAGAPNKITQAEYNRIVSAVTADLNAKDELARTRRATAPRRRGADWVRSRLLKYKDEGLIDEAGAEMADWFIQQNPRLANDLGIGIKGGDALDATGGFYTPASRIVTLIKGSDDEVTAVHEILHHTERMLPEDLQAAVTKEWRKRIGDELKTAATPEQKKFLQNALTRENPRALFDDVTEGRVPSSYYQFSDPSEFWAVNASRIVSGRYTAFNAGMVQKAKRWLTEFIQKAKSVFGLQSDAAVIRGLDAVMRGDGTFVSNRMLKQTLGGSQESGKLYQIGPVLIEADKGVGRLVDVVKGKFEALTPDEIKALRSQDSPTAVITLFRGMADPTTLLHEGARYIRRMGLEAEDMDAITEWVKTEGIKVEHKFGDFVGDAAEVAKAEERFAVAFEQYLLKGDAPQPQLKTLFEKVKEVFAKVYRNLAKGPLGKEIQPEVKAVFDRLFTRVPEKKIESTFDMLMRNTFNNKGAEQEGGLTVLAREAKRRGMGGKSVEDLAKLVSDAPNKYKDKWLESVVIDFPAPVFGKREWTGADILELSNRVQTRRNDLAMSPLKQALFGDPEEETLTESIFTTLVPKKGEGTVTSALRTVGSVFAHSVIGGDITGERHMRNLLPEVRRSLDTSTRIIEQAIGDTITVLGETIREGNMDLMYRYLSGETGMTYKAGRRIVSSGHEFIDGFLGLFRNAADALTSGDRALLQDFAQAINTRPGLVDDLYKVAPQQRSEALARLVYPTLDEIAEARAAAKEADEVLRPDIIRATMQEKATALMKAIDNFRTLKGGDDKSVGSQLAAAMRGATEEGTQPSINEFRFTETLLYLSGVTPRGGKLFIQAGEDYSKAGMLTASKTLLDDAQKIYGTADDQLFARRIAILVGAYGSASRAKAELSGLGLVLTAEERAAYNNWALGYGVTPEMRPRIEGAMRKLGANTKFEADTILGVDMYIPRQARERIAEALGKAQFSEQRLTKAGDLYQMAFAYIKKRMTRGNMVLRSRYFMVNTIDHFFQMSLVVGYAPAFQSFARVALQNVLMSPFTGQALESIVRGLNVIPGVKLNPAVVEKIRDGLSRGGDAVAYGLRKMFSDSKYRVEVNHVLEGRNTPIVIGGHVTTGKRLREIMVGEGILESYNTRRLGQVIRQEGTAFINDGDGIISAGIDDRRLGGNVTTAWAKIKDAATDVTFNVVDDLGDAWAERERVGAAVTLIENGYEPRLACRLTVDALYDYAQSMTKGDRSWLVGLMFPFWAFQKNANQQFINVLATPYGAYRMMVMKRFRDRGSELLTELYYDAVGGELGLDVNEMPQDMQDMYYAIMTQAHEVYGDDIPEDAKLALRMALTGRSSEVVNGKYYELDDSLIGMLKAGGVAGVGGAAMSEYMLPRPDRNILPSYMRERPGVFIAQRRNAQVRLYSGLRGKNDELFYLMLPEASFESAFKHVATVFATGLLVGGYVSAVTPAGPALKKMGVIDETLSDRGLEGTELLQAIKPVLDLERSPIAGPVIGMYAERGYPQRLDPFLASMIQNFTDVPVLRVPALNDPFENDNFLLQMEKIGTEGGPKDMNEILGADYVRTVKELNSKDIDPNDLSTIRDERFYLPPGGYSIAFENTLGEINKEMLIKWSRTPAERAESGELLDMGNIIFALRNLTGMEAASVSASRTAQQEEPVFYTKSKKPF